MRCDVIHEGLNFGPQAGIGDDLVYEAHEDLGSVPVAKRDPAVLVQP